MNTQNRRFNITLSGKTRKFVLWELIHGVNWVVREVCDSYAQAQAIRADLINGYC